MRVSAIQRSVNTFRENCKADDQLALAARKLVSRSERKALTEFTDRYPKATKRNSWLHKTFNSPAQVVEAFRKARTA